MCGRSWQQKWLLCSVVIATLNSFFSPSFPTQFNSGSFIDTDKKKNSWQLTAESFYTTFLLRVNFPRVCVVPPGNIAGHNNHKTSWLSSRSGCVCSRCLYRPDHARLCSDVMPQLFKCVSAEECININKLRRHRDGKRHIKMLLNNDI